MDRLRDEHAVWDDVDGIVCELLDVERRLRATPGQRIDAIDRILDAVDRHLASRTAPTVKESLEVAAPLSKGRQA